MSTQRSSITGHRAWLSASVAAVAIAAMAAPPSMAVPSAVPAAAPPSSAVSLVGDRPLLGLAFAADIGKRLRLQGLATGAWATSTGRVR